MNEYLYNKQIFSALYHTKWIFHTKSHKNFWISIQYYCLQMLNLWYMPFCMPRSAFDTGEWCVRNNLKLRAWGVRDAIASPAAIGQLVEENAWPSHVDPSANQVMTAFGPPGGWECALLDAVRLWTTFPDSVFQAVARLKRNNFDGFKFN